MYNTYVVEYPSLKLSISPVPKKVAVTDERPYNEHDIFRVISPVTVYSQDWACAALHLRGKYDVVKNLFIKHWALLSLMFKTQAFCWFL